MSTTTRTAFITAALIALSASALLASPANPTAVILGDSPSWGLFETIISTFDANTRSGMILQNAKLAS